MANDLSERQFSSFLPMIIAALAVGGLVYWNSTKHSRPASITCDFALQNSKFPLRASSSEAAIGKVRVEGSIKNAGQDGMFNFDGSVVGSTAHGSEDLTGDVFLGRDGAVDGLFLYVQRIPGPNGLRITTLNSNGMLDRDPSKAFLFFDPTEKLSHPANYACAVKQP